MDKSIVPVNQIAVRPSTCYEFSNSNPPEVVEIEDDDTSVETVKRQMEELKLNHKFNEKDVPEIFQTLINDRISDLKVVFLAFDGSSSLLKFDDLHVCFENTNDDWTVAYNDFNTTIETANPEKSIIDHFWFVLKNPNIKLDQFGILNYEDSAAEKNQILDSEKLATLLQSMFDSIDHQIQTNAVNGEGCNEDIFLSMLKHVDSETLENIVFDISWREEGNYRKMKEIVETDQWKQAKTIFSYRVTPSQIDEFFQYKTFFLQLDSVTPEDVLRVVVHVFNSSCPKRCTLSCEPEEYDIGAIIDFLRSQKDGSTIIKTNKIPPLFRIMRFGKCVQLVAHKNSIVIHNC